MGNINQAMIAIMRDIGAIGKDSRNTQQNYQFRGIDTVYNELHEIMAKHGVYSLPEVLEDKHEERQSKSGGALIYRILKMKYNFIAEDGSTVSAVVIGEGMDSGDKASNKAMSVAHKYCLLQAFCIPTAEAKDPDAESHEVTPRKPAPVTAPPLTTPASQPMAEPGSQIMRGIIKEAKSGISKNKRPYVCVILDNGEKLYTYEESTHKTITESIGCMVEIAYTGTQYKNFVEFTIVRNTEPDGQPTDGVPF